MINRFVLRKALVVLFVILPALPRFCLAHTTGLSTGELSFGTNGLEAQLTFATADLIAALAKTETVTRLDADQDGKVTPEELTAGLGKLRTFATAALAVEFDGRRVEASAPQLAVDGKENFQVQLTFPGERPARLGVRAMLFGHLPANHSQFLSVRDVDGQPLGSRMLTARENTLELALPTGTTTASTPKPQISTFGGFFLLGVNHIWTGYDHLMFLLALLLVCGNFKSAIQVVTFFTIAHSITLAFATLNLVSMSSRVVEPAIAASIVYVAAENFVQSEGPKGRWRITFLFGLIHGFGFASVLRDLGVASSTTGVTVPLVAFNLGVESGQIVIAGLILPVIWQLRKWDLFLRRGVPVCSAVVAAVGGYWLVQRLFFN